MFPKKSLITQVSIKKHRASDQLTVVIHLKNSVVPRIYNYTLEIETFLFSL